MDPRHLPGHQVPPADSTADLRGYGQESRLATQWQDGETSEPGQDHDHVSLAGLFTSTRGCESEEDANSAYGTALGR